MIWARECSARLWLTDRSAGVRDPSRVALKTGLIVKVEVRRHLDKVVARQLEWRIRTAIIDRVQDLQCREWKVRLSISFEVRVSIPFELSI